MIDIKVNLELNASKMRAIEGSKILPTPHRVGVSYGTVLPDDTSRHYPLELALSFLRFLLRNSLPLLQHDVHPGVRMHANTVVSTTAGLHALE